MMLRNPGVSSRITSTNKTFRSLHTSSSSLQTQTRQNLAKHVYITSTIDSLRCGLNSSLVKLDSHSINSRSVVPRDDFTQTTRTSVPFIDLMKFGSSLANLLLLLFGLLGNFLFLPYFDSGDDGG